MAEDRTDISDVGVHAGTVAPAAESHGLHGQGGRGYTPEVWPTEGRDAFEEPIVHGVPLTISQCTFQAHIARVTSAEGARAVSDAVSARIRKEDCYADHTCAFAYRLACDSPRPFPGRFDSFVKEPGVERGFAGSNEHEGFGDSGDVGSGEKILHLLQKWDVRHRALVVSRINGGFAMAELLGIRRYKFVVDRAKRLLESSDLASLRRAVQVDLQPPSTGCSSERLTLREAAANGVRDRPDGRSVDDVSVRDDWDYFTVPVSSRRSSSECEAHKRRLACPPGSDVVIIPRPPQGDTGNLHGDDLPRRNRSTAANRLKGGAKHGDENTRVQRRRVLSLAKLSLSSQTVEFPPAHVPSVMGSKGHGVKRGRVNHFAVPTPPLTPTGEVADEDVTSISAQGSEASLPGSIDDSPHLGRGSGWSRPRELDPTWVITDATPRAHPTARGDKSGPGTRPSAAPKFEQSHDISRDGKHSSSSVTTASPGSMSAIMLGVVNGMSNDHQVHRPPPATFLGVTTGPHRQGRGNPDSSAVDAHAAGVDSGEGASAGDAPNDVHPDGAPDAFPLAETQGESSTRPALAIPDAGRGLRSGKGSSSARGCESKASDRAVDCALLPGAAHKGGGCGGVAKRVPGPDSAAHADYSDRLPLLHHPRGGNRDELCPSVGGWGEDSSINTAGSKDSISCMAPRLQPRVNLDTPGHDQLSRVGRCDSPAIWSAADSTPRTDLMAQAHDEPPLSKNAVRGWTRENQAARASPVVRDVPHGDMASVGR